MRNHHLKTLKAFFDKISEAKLTINLAKSEFCHVTLTFLGHAVGQRQVKKKSKRKVQGVPQSQTAALPRPQKEGKTDKSKQAQIELTYEKH